MQEYEEGMLPVKTIDTQFRVRFLIEVRENLKSNLKSYNIYSIPVLFYLQYNVITKNCQKTQFLKNRVFFMFPGLTVLLNGPGSWEDWNSYFRVNV